MSILTPKKPNKDMPIPKPTSAETQNDYVGRCMSEISGEYEQDQAVAICISTYQQGNMKKSPEQRVAMKIEGIHLFNELTSTNGKG